MTEEIDKKEGFFRRVWRAIEAMEKTEMDHVWDNIWHLRKELDAVKATLNPVDLVDDKI